VVFQCPASFTPEKAHVENLRRFFSKLRRGRLRFAWEPRGRWPADLVKSLCRDLELIHCVDPFANPSLHGRPRYYRLHGKGGYRYRFTDGDLADLRALCSGETYALFNNISMWDDALRIQETLGAARRDPVPRRRLPL
jgi:uncharacterized protein YecE (DUF72 family)